MYRNVVCRLYVVVGGLVGGGLVGRGSGVGRRGVSLIAGLGHISAHETNDQNSSENEDLI